VSGHEFDFGIVPMLWYFLFFIFLLQVSKNRTKYFHHCDNICIFYISTELSLPWPYDNWIYISYTIATLLVRFPLMASCRRHHV